MRFWKWVKKISTIFGSGAGWVGAGLVVGYNCAFLIFGEVVISG